MKYLIAAITELIHFLLANIQKRMRNANVDKDDICFILCTTFVATGILYPWCLFLAFLAILPVLREQLPSKMKAIDSASGIPGMANTVTSMEENNESRHFGDELGIDAQLPEQSTLSFEKKNIRSMNSISDKKATLVEKQDPIKYRDLWGIPVLRITDETGKIIQINPNEPVPFESKYFKGVILAMIRSEGEFEKFNRYRDYFKGKQRKFEIQFQGQMTEIPEGPVMLGGELVEKLQLGLVTRTLVQILMKFAMSLNKYLKFGLGEDYRIDENYEVPHLTFPLFRVMDRVVVTPPGEQPPSLGQELPESDADRNLRRNGRSPEMQFKLNHTYSFSFHSMYVDFPTWSLCNFPGYKSIDLKSFIGNQVIKVVVYEFRHGNAQTSEELTSKSLFHYNSRKRYITTMIVSHISIMSPEELKTADELILPEINMPTQIISSEQNGPIEYPDQIDRFWLAGTSIESDVEPEPHTDEFLDSNSDKDRESSADAIDDLSKQYGHNPSREYKRQNVLVSTNVALVALDNDSDFTAIDKNATSEYFSNIESSLDHDKELNTELVLSDTDDSDDDLQFYNPQSNVQVEEVKCFEEDYVEKNSTPIKQEVQRVYGISDDGGFAFKKEQNTPTIVRFIRIESSQNVRPPHMSTLRRLSFRRNDKHSSPTSDDSVLKDNFEDAKHDYVASGDTVLIQRVSTGAYLTIFRGWWVGWTTNISSTKSKGRFSVVIVDSDTLLPLPNGIPLKEGMSFRLRSVRWPNWEIGTYAHGSMTNRGNSLVIFQLSKSGASPRSSIRWSKNGRLINSLQLCILSSSSSNSSLFTTMNHEKLTDRSLDNPKKTNTVVSNYFKAESQVLENIEESKVSTSLQSFPSLNSIENNEYDISTFNATISSWVEFFNRTTNSVQMGIAVRCSVSALGVSKIWVTVRPFEELESLLNDTKENNFLVEEFVEGNDNQNTVENSSYLVRTFYGRSNRKGKSNFEQSPDERLNNISFKMSKVFKKCELNGNSRSNEDSTENINLTLISKFFEVFKTAHIFDTWFMSGNAEKMLRVPIGLKKNSHKRQVCFVARAVWESHWCEEIAILFTSCISFYLPMAYKPHWNLPLQDIISISHLSVDCSPLPGYDVIRLETIGRVHYVAFSNKNVHDRMIGAIFEQISELTFESTLPQGDLGDPRDRFVLKVGRWKASEPRLVLNSRKFPFDCTEISEESYWEFSCKLLQWAIRLDPGNQSEFNIEEVTTAPSASIESQGLLPGREKVIAFLDETVKLKLINIHRDLQLSSIEAACFFVNIYNTLMLHAKLVLGPPPMNQNWATFFETVCYEIGNEVFSLRELEYCVIRGRLCRPATVPKNFPSVPPLYFVLNSLSQSQLPFIYCLTPSTFYSSVNDAAMQLFDRYLEIDMKKGVVTLPKVCEIFKEDFGSDNFEMLKHILRYLPREKWEQLSLLLTSSKLPLVKYLDYKFTTHENVTLVDKSSLEEI